jgi:hypothetical protein
MTREDIEKAADDFADREYEISDIDRDPLYKVFYHGANWRINSVWHDARKDVPEAYFQVLVEDDLDDFEVCMLAKEEECPKNWVRWAYVKDLIPNTED